MGFMSYREPTDFERLELFAIGSAGIEAQERRGQADLVFDTRLPVKGSESPEAKASPIEWGAVCAEDKVFREVRLPQGWKKVATDHPMWSDLQDHIGCARASIFFKAAFYDYEAFIRFNTRYYTYAMYHNKGDGMTFYVYDRGQGTKAVVIYEETPTLPDREKDRDAYYRATNAGDAKAKAWLKERYPDHENPNAYWARGDE